jgi:hypothetical protein
VFNLTKEKGIKNATCWTCLSQVTTFHSTIVKSKGLKWVLMAKGEKKEI